MNNNYYERGKEKNARIYLFITKKFKLKQKLYIKEIIGNFHAHKNS